MNVRTEDQLHAIAEEEGIVAVLEALSPELRDGGILVVVPAPAAIVRGNG